MAQTQPANVRNQMRQANSPMFLGRFLGGIVFMVLFCGFSVMPKIGYECQNAKRRYEEQGDPDEGGVNHGSHSWPQVHEPAGNVSGHKPPESFRAVAD